MLSNIEFSLNVPKQSSLAHQMKPVLPINLVENDTKRTIAMNKISACPSKKTQNNKRFAHLQLKKCFLPLNPTIEPVTSPLNLDIQEKLESIIFKTVDCEILDLFNQMKSKPTSTAFNENLSTILSKLIPSEHKYFFGNIVITDKIDSLSDDDANRMSQERRLVMDQLRALEFVQLQTFARVLQQHNKKAQSTVEKLHQKNQRIPPAQLLAESIKKNSLDKMTFALLMERVLNKVDHLLSSVRDECYVAALSSVQTLLQKDLAHTTMMTKIEHELSRQRQKVHRLTLINEKYNQLISRLLQDIQQVRDMAEHDAKEALNMRLFIHSLHDATYQHRFDRSECKIVKRTSNQLELAFFDNLIRIQMEDKGIGKLSTWSKFLSNDQQVECQLIYASDEHFHSIEQITFELLKNEINNIWNRPTSTSVSISTLIDLIRQFIECSLIANNLKRTLNVCLETLPCKLRDHKLTIDWSTTRLRLDIEWELDERIFHNLPLKSSYCCQPSHNGLCNDLQNLLDRMKPVDGSMVSLYEQVEQCVRPWINIIEGIQDENVKPVSTSTGSISLQKLKQSLEKLFIEQN